MTNLFSANVREITVQRKFKFYISERRAKAISTEMYGLPNSFGCVFFLRNEVRIPLALGVAK
ncbi:MAG TPA: hypothetical protein PLY70_05740 [Saprospiraceae bacterium]|nr:hypothetical protein [Saprospiraceae bacterium]HPN69759.1 hypothetical protein [Saprospiraceae bacterium]